MPNAAARPLDQPPAGSATALPECPFQPGGHQRIDEAAVATVEAVLCNMDPVRREVLLLLRIERLNYSAIGARLSLSQAELKTHIAQAVAEFSVGREEMGESLPGEGLLSG